MTEWKEYYHTHDADAPFGEALEELLYYLNAEAIGWGPVPEQVKKFDEWSVK